MSYIDGLASGLNTSEIIKGLMQVEAIPQTLLKSRVSALQQGLDAYASIRTKISGLRTAAEALTSVNAWQALSVTSSQPEVLSVTAVNGGNALGSTSLSVTQLAQAMAQSSADTFTGLSDAIDGRVLRITANGSTFDSSNVEPPIQTLGDLVKAINADTNLNVRASALQVSPGEYRIVLAAKETGVANAFTVETEGWNNNFEVTSGAQDAILEMGTIQITRSTNVIDDLIDGVSITLKGVSAAPVTIGVERDEAAIIEKVKALVDALNSTVSEIKLRTGYNAQTQSRSVLTGDSTLRSLSQTLVSAVTGFVAGSELGSVGLAGLELKRDGTFSLNETKFKAAYQNDPAAVQALFGETTLTAEDGTETKSLGAAKRLVAFANRALNPVDGLLTSAEDARKNRIKDLNKQVDAWEIRLEKRELTLRRQYTALETMLGQLSSQGQWLSGQISGLAANNSK